ncbi:arginine--tRNA ligase [Hydrogenothermus marinus]|uniref:Arginine--tRNA ligase n=1 Tax=Hydrogenothermus marinus TaxID=133270 RepID=A0A3M0BIS1_9AQUI|nr:arginine--tRNA ligase [Hydrogenothermus marinus]RMA97290.1 arginyl-tRNA synthetase [Hydrogenothermus marinus]
MKQKIKNEILKAVSRKIPEIENIKEKIKVEIPKEEKYGDFSINAAFLLAKPLKKKPIDIANQIKQILEKEDIFEKVEVAGAGFVNLFLSGKFFKDILKKAIVEGSHYGEIKQKDKGKINVEFVSANPTGPLHLGHGRGAVVGNTLANILSYAGYQVEKEFYINDAGNQIKMLGLSVYARYRQIEEPDYPFPEEGYKGEYIKDIANEIYQHFREKILKLSESEAIDFMAEYSKELLLKKIQEDLKLLNVEFDIWFSEKQLYTEGKVQELIEILKEKELVYEKDGALWLKTSIYGDDKDRVLKKKDGSYTYFAGDIAYHFNKLKRGYDYAINIWGADHHGYFPRLKAAMLALGAKEDWLQVLFIQLVKLFKDGKEIKMSKRAGKFITLRDLIEEVGADAVIYFFLTKDSNTHLNFDIDLARKKSSENPVYYVQYAYARISSVFREAKEKFNIDYKNIDEINISLLKEKIEKSIMKKIATLPEDIIKIAENRQPHKLTILAYELASDFHYYYNNYKFLQKEDERLMEARLYLLRAIRNSLATLFKLIGITPLEKM